MATTVRAQLRPLSACAAQAHGRVFAVPSRLLSHGALVATPICKALPTSARSFRASPATGRARMAPIRAEYGSANVTDEGVHGKNDWSSLLAVAAFAGVWFTNRVDVSTHLLLKALASLQLVTSVAALLNYKKFSFDRVTSVIGPSILAANVLSLRYFGTLEAATGLFGYYLCENFGANLFWPAIATLAGALYLGYGTLWYCAATATVAAKRLYDANRGNTEVPLQLIPILAVTAWAVYKEHNLEWALCLFLAQVVWSGLRLLQRMAD